MKLKLKPVTVSFCPCHTPTEKINNILILIGPMNRPCTLIGLQPNKEYLSSSLFFVHKILLLFLPTVIIIITKYCVFIKKYDE